MPSPSRWCAVLIVTFLSLAQPLHADEKPDFLTANIDASVHPGDDFFQYSNGAWLRRNPIPPTESDWGVAQLVRDQLYVTLRAIHERAAESEAPAGSDQQKIADFWRAAMDVQQVLDQGIAPLKQELATIDAAKTLRQVIDAAFAMQALGAESFFSLFVQQDREDSQIYSLYAWQGGLGLPERDFYVNDDKSIRHIRAEYAKYLAQLLRLLGRNEADSAASAASVVRLETALAKAARKLEDLRDPLLNYHRIAPAGLTRLHTPSVNWPAQLAAWHVTPEFVAVGQPEYFGVLDRILRQTPIAVLKDYLRLRLVSSFAEQLGPAFDAAYFDFYRRVLSGQQQQRPRWKRVIDTEFGFGAVPVSIGMMVGRRFVTENFSESAKKRYSAMTHAFVDAYGERIGKLSWMTDATKAKAREKLAAIEAKVGYPERWRDHSSLVIGRASYCANMMNIARWYFQTQLERVGKPVDRSEWLMSPQTYNAYYDDSNNEIVLPAAVFAIPGVADADVDDAVAYAYGGAATIGHELTHGFDDNGRKFDARGNLADWWVAKDVAAFEERAAVVVKQFDAYEPLPGFHINGKASLGENLADLGGLAIALDAFKKTGQYKNNVIIAGQAPLQRFFLAWSFSWLDQVSEELMRQRLLSDFHAPSKWRVLGTVSNTPEFYEAFGVTPAHRMWRDVADRATVW